MLVIGGGPTQMGSNAEIPTTKIFALEIVIHTYPRKSQIWNQWRISVLRLNAKDIVIFQKNEKTSLISTIIVDPFTREMTVHGQKKQWMAVFTNILT